jgi:hypothetical protein
MMELGLTRAPLRRGSDAQPKVRFHPIEPIPAVLANGKFGATADEKPDRLPRIR